MYQSKLHTEHNKNLLASVCLGMLWLLCARVWKWGCACMWVGVCVCVLCLFANPLTLRVVNLPTLRRVNLFLLLCRRVEGLSSAFALSMGGNRGVKGCVKGGVVRIVKPHVDSMCGIQLQEPRKERQHLLPKTKWLYDHSRWFPVEGVRPLSPSPVPAWRLRMDYYIRVSHALTQREL